MKSWLPRLVLGTATGMLVHAVLPGRHPVGFRAAGWLGMVGAACGGLAARWLLPEELSRQGGLVLAGIGALATLLIQGLVSG